MKKQSSFIKSSGSLCSLTLGAGLFLGLNGCSIVVSEELKKKPCAEVHNTCTQAIKSNNDTCLYQVVDSAGNAIDPNIVASFVSAHPVDCGMCESMYPGLPSPGTGDFQQVPYCQKTGDTKNPTCYLSFDYNCDGKAEQEHVNRLVCNATNQSPGWGPNPSMPKESVQIPECGVEGFYYTGATFDPAKPADTACTVKAPNGNPRLIQRCK